MKSAERMTANLKRSMEAIFESKNEGLDKYILPYFKEFEKEIKKELNEFITDIAKLLPGSDGLGYDGLSWSIDDFKNAIQEVREDQVNKCVEAVKEIIEHPITMRTFGNGDEKQGFEHPIFSSGTTSTFKEKAIQEIKNTIKEDV